MKKLLFLTLIIFPFTTFSQCVVDSNAIETINLVCTGGTAYRSGVAYNPEHKIYYSVNSGSASYQIETFDESGTFLQTNTQGFDYRGLWWNSNLNQLEGNGYSSNGIFVQALDSINKFPLDSGTVVIPGMNQPDDHSCGAHDPINDEIIYYELGNIERYDRNTGTYLGSISITSLPVSFASINTTSIGYTGCVGKEVVIYNYTDKRVYFVDLATGAYVATSQLPNNAPSSSNQRMAFARNLFWLFNTGSLTWQGYRVFECTSTYDTISTTVCDTFTSPSGKYSWYSTGIYHDTILNALGCDSILTIDLSIDPIDTSVSQIGDLLTAGEIGASYRWLNCDSNYSAIPAATSQSFTPSENGNYSVEITGVCTDTSACVSVTNVNIPERQHHAVTIYPNPTSANFTIQAPQLLIQKVQIFDPIGRPVLSQDQPKTNQIQTNSLHAGEYIVLIHTSKTVIRKRLMIFS